ncbi:MAG: diguanylate cyclase [Phycisphaerae bacterium]
MPQVTTEAKAASSSDNLEQQIRARIDSLSYLPTTAAVAMKFVELGKNLDAEPSDYAKVISADSSLSSKILALANSSWAGVRNKVTNVKTAVNLLGLGTVRTLAISYCMTGLHNELRLSAEESHMFWESSLCKAVAAKKYASLFDAKLVDEAFVGGLFQDFAIAVMYSTAKEPFLQLLQDPVINVHGQLQKERGLFGMDHAEVGRMLAQKLELPDLYIDAVAFHHNHEKLSEFVEQKVIADAIYIASLFPHMLNVWHRDDADALCAFLKEDALSTDAQEYLAKVQEEFNQVYSFFHEGGAPDTQLTELLECATREVADNTTQLVGTVNELMRQAAATGMAVNELVTQQSVLEEKTTRDQLTGVLNREGFTVEAKELLTKAARYGIGFAVVYLDIDKFKAVNDNFGHEFGDLALTTVVSEITGVVPQHDLIGRMGGDEFVVLLNDCSEKEATQIVKRIIANLAAKTVRKRNHSTQMTLSAGLLYVRPSNQEQPLDAIVNAADKLMYVAKRAGGNQVEGRTIQT